MSLLLRLQRLRASVADNAYEDTGELISELDKCVALASTPLKQIIFCPRCGVQHVDEATSTWENPPHKSHLCLECGWIFRVADEPTCGVREILTHGERDNLPVRGQQSLERMITVRYYRTDLGSK